MATIQSTNTNVCTRCGKLRIIAKTWTEEIETYGGISKITRTETICADPECQKEVARLLQKQQAERQMMQKEAELRALERTNPRNRKKTQLT